MLVSPISMTEARIVAEGGADILDIKNVGEGSLGAQGPWVIKEIVDAFRPTGIMCSAALGDLPQKPGTVALAAYGAALCGTDYLKAGLHGSRTYEEALAIMNAVVRAVRMVRPDILVVASGYADCRRFGGVGYREVVRAARDSGSNAVMVDTAIKDGKDLFDALAPEEIAEFITLGHEAGLLVAVAGSVKLQHLPVLAQMRPDIVGIRGAACDDGDRTRGITAAKVHELMATARRLNAAGNVPDAKRRERPPAERAAVAI
jgi:uncharacterized protein (UPF0264 family)